MIYNTKLETRQVKYMRNKKMAGIPQKRDVADAILRVVEDVCRLDKDNSKIKLGDFKKWILDSSVKYLTEKGFCKNQSEFKTKSYLGLISEDDDFEYLKIFYS